MFTEIPNLTWLDDEQVTGRQTYTVRLLAATHKEEIETFMFYKTDEVPDFVVVDFEKGEQVEGGCPFCDGTMHIAKDAPRD
ncbi:hypothetical protein [Halobacillus massiliensis]|uniref:hypothetical protein n=1 Tax=Halobacillus massiliensis TaxID=1926286 RepID=UPI0009E47D1A|nr:hypothetical protein [Halobacillus massiliensis]